MKTFDNAGGILLNVDKSVGDTRAYTYAERHYRRMLAQLLISNRSVSQQESDVDIFIASASREVLPGAWGRPRCYRRYYLNFIKKKKRKEKETDSLVCIALDLPFLFSSIFFLVAEATMEKENKRPRG